MQHLQKASKDKLSKHKSERLNQKTANNLPVEIKGWNQKRIQMTYNVMKSLIKDKKGTNTTE